MLVNPNIIVILNGQVYSLSGDATRIIEEIADQAVTKAMLGEDLQVTLTDQLTGKRDRFMFRWDETVVKTKQ